MPFEAKCSIRPVFGFITADVMRSDHRLYLCTCLSHFFNAQSAVCRCRVATGHSRTHILSGLGDPGSWTQRDYRHMQMLFFLISDICCALALASPHPSDTPGYNGTNWARLQRVDSGVYFMTGPPPHSHLATAKYGRKMLLVN